MDRFEAIDLGQSGVKIGLDGEMGHDDQRHGALVGRVVSRVVLDDAGDADALVAEDLGQLGQNAGAVGDCKALVISALDLVGGGKRHLSE